RGHQCRAGRGATGRSADSRAGCGKGFGGRAACRTNCERQCDFADAGRIERFNGPLLPRLAALQGRQGSGHGARSFSGAEPSRHAGCTACFRLGCWLVEVRFARVDFRRSGYAFAGLFSLGARSCTADRGYGGHADDCGVGGVEARRQHPAAHSRRGADVLLQQEERQGTNGRMKRIAILGAGSWGTALSVVLSHAHRKHEICLWARDAALAEIIKRNRENSTYLPGIFLPAEIGVTSDLRSAVTGADRLIGAMPSAHARSIYTLAAPDLSPETVVVSATKGVEPATHLRMSKVIAQVLAAERQAESPRRQAVLSGPSFAAEAARGEPTAIVLASEDDALAGQLQEEFAGPSFRVYTNSDVLGVEIAGAMKNVIAIAAGTCQGLGFGSNVQAALVTRGLAEMTRLSTALGGRAETLFGLAGLGDLVLTCPGGLSRNRHVGIELGKGRSLTEILAGMRMVAEGVGTAAALLALAREHQIELPITEQVEAILHGGKAPRDAI